ncbi:MAG: ketopantoate reductase family protein [Planctomycetota bacterium]
MADRFFLPAGIPVIMFVAMNILVYGGGSVGLGVASCLLKAGGRVDIIARQKTVLALRAAGLVRTGIFGDYHAGPAGFGAYCSVSQVGAKTYDYVLVCTKSFDSAVAAEDISKHHFLLGEDGKIVLFQNGWGNAEAFLPFFGPQQVYNARVITGFRRSSENEVEITVHADPIHLGSLFGSDSACMKRLCESITAGGIPCEVTEDIEKDLWAKMLYNCALNPLGAILEVPYGLLAEHESTRGIMRGVVEEIFEVMAAAGYKTHWRTALDFLEVFYAKLVPDTAEHKSSTLQDILAKKKTEIDALNGARFSTIW